MSVQHGLVATVLIAVMGWSATGVQAADYPIKPIKFIVSFTPGGGIDTVARALAPRLSKVLGQAVVIENRPGASGSIAAKEVIRANPDGYTLFFASSGDLVFGPLMTKDPGYDARKDFRALSQVHRIPYLVVVNSSSPIKTIQELIAIAKKDPGKLTYGTFGVGSSNGMGAELLQHEAGIKFLQIPFKGSSQTMTELLAGRLDLGVESPGATKPHRASGALRALAVADPLRLAFLPEIPTLVESGYPGVVFGSWGGLLAPVGTPNDIVEKLSGAIQTAVKSKDYSTWLIESGWVPAGGTSEEFRKYIEEELALWSKTIRNAGIVPQ
jgi:tripartite-type tricarboxylate transporter receptor subunit TctC